jgi:hypothetical protein
LAPDLVLQISSLLEAAARSAGGYARWVKRESA